MEVTRTTTLWKWSKQKGKKGVKPSPREFILSGDKENKI